MKRMHKKEKKDREKHFSPEEMYQIPDKGYKGTKWQWVQYLKEINNKYDN